MTTFKVGDRARVKFCLHYPQYVGCEVTITQGLHSFRNAITGEIKTGYGIDLVVIPGATTSCLPEQLEPITKSPAREIDTVVSWSDCAWRPEGVRV